MLRYANQSDIPQLLINMESVKEDFAGYKEEAPLWNTPN